MPRLTDSQVDNAIEQMKQHARLAIEANKQGAEYQMMSARSALHDLGFDGDAADRVIHTIASRGFDYCLDPMVESYSGVEEKIFRPSQDSCYWGADQLLSRLLALRS